MDIAKKFLGDNQIDDSFDEAIFNKLFSVGANQGYYIIKSKIPLPHQDITDKHTHDNYEFTISLTHSPILLIEEKQFILPRRNIFPANPGQDHGPAEIAHQHRIIAMQISQQKLQELSFSLYGKRDVEFRNIPAPIDLHMEHLIEMFIHESYNKQAGYEFIMDNLSSMLGIKILRALHGNLDLREKPFNDISKQEIHRAIDYLHANFNKDFSLTDLAEIVGFSKYHFIRVFKKETGKTPYHYFIDLKLEKAIELIKMQKYSVTDICFMCGFKDHSHFCRVFKNRTGMTPSVYKGKCK